eukprot:10795563-Ditylum_brightwellii.AAC.1
MFVSKVLKGRVKIGPMSSLDQIGWYPGTFAKILHGGRSEINASCAPKQGAWVLFKGPPAG